MTPQLQQAIRLLQMPALELQAHIRELLESNVMLEPVEDTESTGILEAVEPPAPAESAVRKAESTVEVVEENWSEQSAGPSEAPWSQSDDDDRQQEFADGAGESLTGISSRPARAGAPRAAASRHRARHRRCDQRGRLSHRVAARRSPTRCGPSSTARPTEIERVLALVQALDPPGVGARSVGECIELQLQQLDPVTPGLSSWPCVSHAIISSGSRIASCRSCAASCRPPKMSWPPRLALVRSCHPRPGAIVSAGAAEYVIPDVFVRRTEQGGWAVEINSATLPRVRLNQGYASLIGRNASHATMRAQLQEARWLLKSLEIRNETLMKVARSIVERQTAFLEHGEEYMRPMILKDIAEAIEMHESTISRVTSGKYMHTPRGVFELRYFFSSQVEGADGSGTSSTAIRAKIRKLIKEEDAETPLSDGRIAEVLSG